MTFKYTQMTLKYSDDLKNVNALKGGLKVTSALFQFSSRFHELLRIVL